MRLAERAGRKLEPKSNFRPRGMTVIADRINPECRNKIRPIGLLHFISQVALHRAIVDTTQDQCAGLSLEYLRENRVAVGWDQAERLVYLIDGKAFRFGGDAGRFADIRDGWHFIPRPAGSLFITPRSTPRFAPAQTIAARAGTSASSHEPKQLTRQPYFAFKYAAGNDRVGLAYPSRCLFAHPRNVANRRRAKGTSNPWFCPKHMCKPKSSPPHTLLSA